MQPKPDQSGIKRQPKGLSVRMHRNRLLHWIAFAASLVSLALLLSLAFNGKDNINGTWVTLDVGLGIAFAFEFLTRSGFGQNPGHYTRTHLFDFIAMAPALALVYYGVRFDEVYVWAILFTRTVRAIDRLLGDGYVQRTTLAVVDGIEEEITSRVFLRMLNRVQVVLDRVHLTNAIANTLVENKGSVLQRVRAAHPQKGLGVEIARIAGLDAVLERAEERTYDAIVEVFRSPELDRALQDMINSSISSMKEGIAIKEWREHFGIGQEQAASSKKRSNPN